MNHQQFETEIGSLDTTWKDETSHTRQREMDSREREQLTKRLDHFFLHKYLGPPIMVACFALLFWGSFALGKPVSAYLGSMFESLSQWLEQSVAQHLPPVLMSLLSDGVIRGIGSALAFFPQMLLFFAFYTIITETGYASRIASLMHRPMARLKMGGGAFTPLILGYSCNVTAIISTRSIPKRIDRLIIMLISSFTPCSARLGVILYIAAAFFAPLTATLVMSCLIVLSWAISALVYYLIKRRHIDSGDVDSPVDLPPYHLPTIITVLRATVFRTLDFLNRIKNVVIISSVVVWFLSSFPLGTTFDYSIAARIGHLLEPLGRLMGLNWQLIVALIFGFFAKETTLSTLGVLYHASQGLGNLGSIMSHSISPLAGLTFLVIYMFYTPCVATATAIYKESRSFLFSTLSILVSLTVAFVLGILVFSLGKMFF